MINQLDSRENKWGQRNGGEILIAINIQNIERCRLVNCGGHWMQSAWTPGAWDGYGLKEWAFTVSVQDHTSKDVNRNLCSSIKRW